MGFVHSRLRLGVNIDHVATIRNARGGRHPDPVRAAIWRRRRARRHHRPSARGSPPHLRRGHPRLVPRSTCRSISKWRRPTRCWRSRCAIGRTPPASCRKSATSGRPRAGSTRRAAAVTSAPCRRAGRRGHPRLPVHRARSASIDAAPRAGRAGGRTSYRRLLRCDRAARDARTRRHRRARPHGRRRWASNVMPATV